MKRALYLQARADVRALGFIGARTALELELHGVVVARLERNLIEEIL